MAILADICDCFEAIQSRVEKPPIVQATGQLNIIIIFIYTIVEFILKWCIKWIAGCCFFLLFNISDGQFFMPFFSHNANIIQTYSQVQ